MLNKKINANKEIKFSSLEQLFQYKKELKDLDQIHHLRYIYNQSKILSKKI